MKRHIRNEISPGAAAARGALAGLVGGLTLVAVDRVLSPRLGGPRRERDWDNQVAGTLRRVGLRVAGRHESAAGIVAGLAYTALLGAAYGLARRQLRRSPATVGMLDAALVYGASLVSREPRRPPRRVRGRSARAARALSSVALFGTTTAAAYKALSRRAV
jgi:hypothetical protein